MVVKEAGSEREKVRRGLQPLPSSFPAPPALAATAATSAADRHLRSGEKGKYRWPPPSRGEKGPPPRNEARMSLEAKKTPSFHTIVCSGLHIPSPKCTPYDTHTPHTRLALSKRVFEVSLRFHTLVRGQKKAHCLSFLNIRPGMGDLQTVGGREESHLR